MPTVKTEPQECIMCGSETDPEGICWLCEGEEE